MVNLKSQTRPSKIFVIFKCDSLENSVILVLYIYISLENNKTVSKMAKMNKYRKRKKCVLEGKNDT